MSGVAIQKKNNNTKSSYLKIQEKRKLKIINNSFKISLLHKWQIEHTLKKLIYASFSGTFVYSSQVIKLCTKKQS